MSKNKISRRDFLKTAGMTLAGVTLASCGPAAEPTDSGGTATALVPASGGSSGEAVSLRFASWDSASGQDVYNGIVAEFNKEFPNIAVQVEFTPDGYDNKILTGLAGGNAPDVYMWWNYPSLLAKKGIVDLTPFAERGGDQGLDLTQYYPQIIDYTRLNGVLVGTPNAFTPRAIFYNKKLFSDAGVTEPTSDWNWTQFLEAAQMLTSGEGAEKVYGIYSDPSTYWMQGYVWSRGADFISEDGKKATGFLDSPDTMEIVQRWADMVTELELSPTADTQSTMGGAAQMFISGKLAMMDNGRWPQTDLMKTENLEFGLVLPPLDDKTNERVAVLHTSAFCINPQTKFVDQSWELAKYLGGPVGNRLFGEAGWAVPCLPSVVEELGWDADPIEKVWIEATPFGTVKPCFQRTTVWSEADQEIANTLQAIWLGQQTVESGLKAAATKVDEILATAPPMM